MPSWQGNGMDWSFERIEPLSQRGLSCSLKLEADADNTSTLLPVSVRTGREMAGASTKRWLAS